MFQSPEIKQEWIYIFNSSLKLGSSLLYLAVIHITQQCFHGLIRILLFSLVSIAFLHGHLEFQIQIRLQSPWSPKRSVRIWRCFLIKIVIFNLFLTSQLVLDFYLPQHDPVNLNRDRLWNVIPSWAIRM